MYSYLEIMYLVADSAEIIHTHAHRRQLRKDDKIKKIEYNLFCT